MKDRERVLKAVANRRRLAILNHLKRNKQSTVGDIAEAIRLSMKATSKHLSILKAADIVEAEKHSLLVFYSLNSVQKPFIQSLLSGL